MHKIEQFFYKFLFLSFWRFCLQSLKKTCFFATQTFFCLDPEVLSQLLSYLLTQSRVPWKKSGVKRVHWSLCPEMDVCTRATWARELWGGSASISCSTKLPKDSKIQVWLKQQSIWLFFSYWKLKRNWKWQERAHSFLSLSSSLASAACSSGQFRPDDFRNSMQSSVPTSSSSLLHRVSALLPPCPLLKFLFLSLYYKQM